MVISAMGRKSRPSCATSIMSIFMGRSDSVSKMIAMALGALLLAVLIGQRILSYSVNHTDVVKLPINDIERECPKPSYPVLGSSAATTPPKICLTTLTDAAKADPLQRLVRWRNFNSLLDMTWPNKENYCRKHGYALFNESMSLDQSRPPSWSKIKAAQRLLREESCDWVFWLDADTIIMNSNKRVEDFLPLPDSGIDLLLTEQKGPSWNAGAWLIRNTPWSLAFLDHWWGMKDFVKPKGLAVSGDNDALHSYLSSMHPLDSHIGVPPRCLFNSVAKFSTKEESALYANPEVVKKQDWYLHVERYHKGDLVAHIAGKSILDECTGRPR
jgi:galactosyl transferase GMA12/MNN10 family